MNCKYCNAEVPEGTTVCPFCGQAAAGQADEPVQAAEPQADGQVQASGSEGQYVNFASDGEQPSMQGPKKKKGKMIAAAVAAAVLVVAVLVGVTSRAQISNFVKKTFSSPVSYYQYVEKKNRDKGKEVLVSYFDTLQKSMTSTETQGILYKLELGQTLKTMLSMTGMDFSKLDTVEIACDARKDKDSVDSKAKVRLNGQDLLTMDYYMNFAQQQYYYRFPELSEKYLDVSAMMKDEETGDMFEALGNMDKVFPSGDMVNRLVTNYTDIFINDMDKVEKSSADLEANGVKGSYTDLKVTCSGEKAYAVIEKAVEALKSDADIKSYLEGIDPDLYRSYSEEISDLDKEIKGDKDEVTKSGSEAVMDVYVDGKGEIAGRVLTLKGEDQNIKITSVEPQKGADFGYEFSVESDGKKMVTVLGKGTKKNGKVSGEYSLSLDESLSPSKDVITSTTDLAQITVTDLDEEIPEDGQSVNGKITISTKVIPMLASYSLEFEMKGQKEDASSSVAVICGGEKMFTLTASVKKPENIESSKPGEGAEICDAMDDDAMAAYASELKVDELIKKINEISGVDISKYLDMTNGMGEPGGIDGGSLDGSLGYSLDEDSTEDMSLGM